jgi:glucose/mannose transport system permease protein
MMNNYKLSNFNFGRAFIYLILIFFALIYLAPLYVMFTTSLKDIEEIRSGNLMALPLDPTLYAWKKAWSSACTGSECQGLAPYFWNSVRIVVPAVIISTVVGAFNGYALAKWKFKGSELLFGALLFGCFIPFQVILLPMAKLLGELGLANTVTGLVLGPCDIRSRLYNAFL